MFEDKTLTCADCGSQYVFTASEQEFYREKGFENYTAQGAYLQCSWLLLGQNYLYDEEVACPGRPEGKSH